MNTITSLYRGEPMETLSLFGLLQKNILDHWHSQLRYPENYSNFGFGNWIYQGDTIYKKLISDYRSFRDFSVVEIKGLMDALSDAELLGATYNILSDVSFPDRCIIPSEENIFFNGDYVPSSQRHLPLEDKNEETCRLTSCLYQLKNYTSGVSNDQTWTPKLTSSIDCIAMYLCTNVNTSCLPFPKDNNVSLAYAIAIRDYLFHHLAHYVFHSTVISNENDLVVSSRQRNLALGYYVDNTSIHFVPGILEHAYSIKDPTWNIVRKKIHLYNCYHAVEAETNFMWKGK